jgi:hypothetical protein
VEEETVEVTQPFAERMIKKQTAAIQHTVLGHLVKQLAIEMPVDVHGTGPAMDFGLISNCKLASDLLSCRVYVTQVRIPVLRIVHARSAKLSLFIILLWSHGVLFNNILKKHKTQ